MKSGSSNKTESEGIFEFAYGGSRYRFVKPDVLQSVFYDICRNGVFYEHEILKDMRQRLKRGDLVIDVGANIGNHAVFLAGVCDCDVIALEPVPKSFELLTRNIRINGLEDRVTAINIAAGAKAGYGNFSFPTTGAYEAVAIRDTGITKSIRIVPLDELEPPRQPRVLKIDVEGSEIEVLRGAASLIKTARPFIYAETFSEQAFDEVCAHLNSMQYRVLHFFDPATFLFANAEDTVLASRTYDPGNQLGRLCLRHCAERDKANSKVRKLKDKPWRRFRKRIKNQAHKVDAHVRLWFR